MKVLTELKYRSSFIIGPVLGASLLIYFLYHAVQGDRGLLAYWQLAKQVERARVTSSFLDNLRRNPSTLNRDMLDERARFMLGYVRPKEIIIFLDKI